MSKKRYRNSGSGEFVDKETAEANPDTTVSETVKPPIGIYPMKLWLEDRRNALTAAIKRNPRKEDKYNLEISWIDTTLEKFSGLDYQGGV